MLDKSRLTNLSLSADCMSKRSYLIPFMAYLQVNSGSIASSRLDRILPMRGLGVSLSMPTVFKSARLFRRKEHAIRLQLKTHEALAKNDRVTRLVTRSATASAHGN